MIASLMMYARPELEAAHGRYWASIRTELTQRGIESPENLSNDTDAFVVWRDPDLVLSQTCGMPYRTHLHADVALIGTPDFGLEGCPAGYYRSPIVVRSNDTRTEMTEFAQARFAYNGTGSQSGFAAIYNMVKPMGFWFTDRVQSGGHLASAQMVAQGNADIAALDGVTWRLIQRYEPWASDLKVLGWTEPTPGLPYIAAKKADAQKTFDAVKAAIDGLSVDDRDTLGIQDLIPISHADYMAVPNPPAEDC